MPPAERVHQQEASSAGVHQERAAEPQGQEVWPSAPERAAVPGPSQEHRPRERRVPRASHPERQRSGRPREEDSGTPDAEPCPEAEPPLADAPSWEHREEPGRPEEPEPRGRPEDAPRPLRANPWEGPEDAAFPRPGPVPGRQRAESHPDRLEEHPRQRREEPRRLQAARAPERSEASCPEAGSARAERARPRWEQEREAEHPRPWACQRA